MSDEWVRVERGRIATVTLARASKKNALSPDLMRELEAAALGFRDDAESRVVVVRADGDTFSAGADLQEPPVAADLPLVAKRRAARLGERLLRSIYEIPQPTICAVQGVAAGGGACIATACDFRIAADDARIGYPEVKLGMNLMWNALPLCVALVGPARAKRLIMTGALLPAPTLAEWGFVDECVPRAELETTTTALANELAQLPPTAVQMIKESVNAVSGEMARAAMHMDADQWLLTAQSEDFREGIRSFLERRAPTFRGD